MGATIGSYLFSFQQVINSNFKIIFFVFYRLLRSMVKQILYQISNHQRIRFHGEGFFLLEWL
jgi:hypothetical protein